MLSRSFVAATALLISSVAYPVAQAAPQLLAQTQQLGGGSAGGGGGGGQMPSGGASGANTPQTRGGGDMDRGRGMRDRGSEGMRDRGDMRERGDRGGVRMRVDRERGEYRRGGRDRVGVYVRGGYRDGWRHRHGWRYRDGVRVWVGGPRCRTIIVKKRYHHRVVIKKIRRCR